MGIFSVKKKVIVNTTVQRVFEEASIPDSPKSGIIKGIMAGDDLVEYMLEQTSGSLGIRADVGYNWAKSNDYFWGMPQSKILSGIDARQIVAQTIARSEGPITTYYNNYGALNSIHWAYTECIRLWQWNPVTNRLPGLEAGRGQVYLYDIVPYYSKDTLDWNKDVFTLGLLENWGFSPLSGVTPSRPYNTVGGMGQYANQSPYKQSANTTDYVIITYEWKDSNGVIQKGTHRIDMLMDLEADYHQVRFRRSNGTVGFFTYKQGSGTYPDIDGVFTIKYEAAGTYYPWAYFHFNKLPAQAQGAKAFWDCKKWCRYLGADYEKLMDTVQLDPNLQDVQQSILFMGVNPGSEEQYDQNYLFEYCAWLYHNGIRQRQKAQGLPDKFGDYSNALDQVITIQDKHFGMDFSYSGIKFERKTGKVAPVGKFTGKQLTAENSSGLLSTIQPAYRYQKQVLDAVYEEVTIFNPQLHYRVTHKKGHVAGPGAKELLFPLDKAIVDQLSVRGKEKLLARALHMCVNTLTIIKAPWYSSTFFKIILIAVAIVVTVFTLGQAWQTIMAAAALGATALAITILQMVVTAIAIDYGVKLFVKTVGAELGLLTAVLLMAVSAYGMSTEATWSENLMAISSNMAKTASQDLQAEMAQLMKDISAELATFDDMMAGLDETAKELGLGKTPLLGPLDVMHMSPAIIPGETPGDFFQRTIHTGNIGAASLDVAQHFVATKLTLPDINETINEVNGYGVSV